MRGVTIIGKKPLILFKLMPSKHPYNFTKLSVDARNNNGITINSPKKNNH